MPVLEETMEPGNAYVDARIVTPHLNQDDFYDNYVAVVENLAKEESTTSRIAACRILYAFYGRVSPQGKEELWKILSRLSLDDNIRVRRMVTTTLGNLSREVDIQAYTSYIIPVLDKLAEEQKAELCVEATKLLLYISTEPHLPEDTRQAIIPVLLKYSRHSSWVIRYMIAKNIFKIQKTLRACVLKSGLTALLPNLLKDSEPRVQTAAENQFQMYCKNLIGTREKNLSKKRN